MHQITLILTKLIFCIVLVGFALSVDAATLGLSPATGVYKAGSTFTVAVIVGTGGQPVNAADGTISFNPSELSVVAVSRGASIFNLWTTEPMFSNAAGTVSFSGGSPTGYTGAVGTVMSVTFRTVSAGSPRVTFSTGSVLAADGKGTNVLTSMGSGAYTVSAQTTTPQPETIVEYVPPANTPATPKIISKTHEDQNLWYKATTAELVWSLPSDVTSVRTSLDGSKTAIPTKVYDTPIKSITLSDLPEGESYFHLQFKNKDGWGKVAHYRLAVDASAPKDLIVATVDGANLANPEQVFKVGFSDKTGAPVKLFKVQVDGSEPEEFPNIDTKNQFTLKSLKPGYHTITVTVIDEAANTAVVNTNVTIESFPAPAFTDVPAEVSPQVTPVFTGSTRANASVEITLSKSGSNPQSFSSKADADGVFRFIPEGHLDEGVYEITAVATDEFGARSAVSDVYKVAVQPSGLVRIGSMLVTVLSILVPVLAMFGLLILGALYLLVRMRRFRRNVGREAHEVTSKLQEQFAHIYAVLNTEEERLAHSRKTKKVTQGEEELLQSIRNALKEAENRVKKEVQDVTDLTD